MKLSKDECLLVTSRPLAGGLSARQNLHSAGPRDNLTGGEPASLQGLDGHETARTSRTSRTKRQEPRKKAFITVLTLVRAKCKSPWATMFERATDA
eukprot:486353-Prymnesium_polylepis.1